MHAVIYNLSYHINSTLKRIVQETLVKYAVFGLFCAALDDLDEVLCFLAFSGRSEDSDTLRYPFRRLFHKLDFFWGGLRS